MKKVIYDKIEIIFILIKLFVTNTYLFTQCFLHLIFPSTFLTAPNAWFLDQTLLLHFLVWSSTYDSIFFDTKKEGKGIKLVIWKSTQTVLFSILAQ